MTAGVRSTADEVWTCDCGQSYRVTGVNGRVRLWPRDGNASYSPQGITPRCRCIRCGQPIPAEASAASADANQPPHRREA